MRNMGVTDKKLTNQTRMAHQEAICICMHGRKHHSPNNSCVSQIPEWARPWRQENLNDAVHQRETQQAWTNNMADGETINPNVDSIKGL